MRRLRRLLDWLRYDLPQGVHNLWRWFPIIWYDRDWDSSYLLYLMERKLDQMGECFEKHGHLVNSPRYTRQVRICAELCRRITDDSALGRMLDAHGLTRYGGELGTALESYYQEYLGLMIGKHLRCWWD